MLIFHQLQNKLRAKNSSTRKLRINKSRRPWTIQQLLVLGLHRPVHQCTLAPSKEEMDQLYAELNQCKMKAVALSLIDPFADQSIDQRRSVPTVALSSRLVCSVAATHHRNPLVSPPNTEFLLFSPLICNNLRYNKQLLAFMLSTFPRTANNNG